MTASPDKMPESASRSNTVAHTPDGDLLAALKDCQRVLHDLGRPSAPLPNIQSVWAQCIAAELRARKAILRAEGGGQ